MAARIDYFDETAVADVGMRVYGGSFEDILQGSAQGLLGLMISDPDALPEGRPRTLSLQDISREFLLRALLEEIVFLKDAESIVLVVEGITLAPPNGTGAGEIKANLSCREIELSEATGLFGIDVKAVTFHDFQVTRM
ncbi:MAG: archease, partial [bacterium]